MTTVPLSSKWNRSTDGFGQRDQTRHPLELLPRQRRTQMRAGLLLATYQKRCSASAEKVTLAARYQAPAVRPYLGHI